MRGADSKSMEGPSDPRLPALTRAEVRRRSIAIVTRTLVLTGAVLGGLLIPSFGNGIGIDTDTWPTFDRVLTDAALGALSTAILGAWALSGTRLETEASLWRALGRALVGGFLNPGLYFTFGGAWLTARHASADMPWLDGLGSLVFVWLLCLPAAIASLPLGLVYGTGHAMGLHFVRRAIEMPSRASLSHAHGIALAIIAVGLGAALLLAQYTDTAERLAPYAYAVLGLLALVELAALARETATTRRALRQLHGGGWGDLELVPCGEVDVPEELAPLVPGASLAVVRRAGHTPYRDKRVALALVPSR